MTDNKNNAQTGANPSQPTPPDRPDLGREDADAANAADHDKVGEKDQQKKSDDPADDGSLPDEKESKKSRLGIAALIGLATLAIAFFGILIGIATGVIAWDAREISEDQLELAQAQVIEIGADLGD